MSSWNLVVRMSPEFPDIVCNIVVKYALKSRCWLAQRWLSCGREYLEGTSQGTGQRRGQGGALLGWARYVISVFIAVPSLFDSVTQGFSALCCGVVTFYSFTWFKICVPVCAGQSLWLFQSLSLNVTEFKLVKVIIKVDHTVHRSTHRWPPQCASEHTQPMWVIPKEK